MRTDFSKKSKALLIWVMLVLCVNVWGALDVLAMNSEDGTKVDNDGDWGIGGGNKSLVLSPISIYKNTQCLTIQDSNPVNTITVKITSHETGAVVFENVYPQGQTSFIVIPLSGWSAGSYTIELFGRENNGYLVGTFQI